MIQYLFGNMQICNINGNKALSKVKRPPTTVSFNFCFCSYCTIHYYYYISYYTLYKYSQFIIHLCTINGCKLFK